ncbi:MAG: VOC family protein [Dehalococcoidia bacterium]|nr:VOC family protein [Dehalococcoidia bacterium]
MASNFSLASTLDVMMRMALERAREEEQMPEIKKYAQGWPSWVELATTDEKGALKFYGSMFGWRNKPQPMGPGASYHMQLVKGLEAAAIVELSLDDKKRRIPAHWRTYFTVLKVDETARRIAALGGKLVAPPFDVMEAGRMAVGQDPQGAMFNLWQKKNHIGSRIRNETGAVNWIELLTTDSKKAVAFYSGLLGVESHKMAGPGDYTLLSVDGEDVAGVMQISEEMGPIPPSWNVYFGVGVVGAATKKAQSLGGKVLMDARTEPGVGRFATLQDPQGAVFSLFKPSKD